MNLLKETIERLSDNDKTPDQVKWVGDSEVFTDWNNFQEISDVEYDNGFGGNEVSGNLLIVGEDWWLERGEYDGSEWWEFKTLPVKPKEKMKLSSVLVGDYEDDLKGINSKE